MRLPAAVIVSMLLLGAGPAEAAGHAELGARAAGSAVGSAAGSALAGTLTVGGATLHGAVVGPAVTVVAPDLGGTVRAKFRLDGTYLGTARTLPLTWPLQATPGTHELEVRFYDEDGEQHRQSATFTVRATAPAPTPAPTPKATPVPSATPKATPVPSVTPKATPVPSATPKATPVPSPSGAPTAPPAVPGVTRDVVVRDGAGLVAALAAARPGTRITLADGVYSARQQLTIATACTAAAPCVLRGGRGAVLDGTGLGGHYGLHLVGADHWTVSGLTVRNASKGIVADRTNRAVIDGVEVAQIGAEGIHLRGFSSDNVVNGSLVHHTGLTKPQFGEGVYVGSAKSNWGTVSGGLPDRSDRNRVTGNRIWATGAESVDIKEGTTAGVLAGNTFDGAGMAGENSADSWVDVKGNGWSVTGNTGTNALLDGFQTHVLLPGWGQGNTFAGNRATVGAAGYGFRFHDAATSRNVLRCDNVVVGAALGTANQPCA